MSQCRITIKENGEVEVKAPNGNKSKLFSNLVKKVGDSAIDVYSFSESKEFKDFIGGLIAAEKIKIKKSLPQPLQQPTISTAGNSVFIEIDKVGFMKLDLHKDGYKVSEVKDYSTRERVGSPLSSVDETAKALEGTNTFDIERLLGVKYHGTANEFDIPSEERIGAGVSVSKFGSGFYVTTSKEAVNKYYSLMAAANSAFESLYPNSIAIDNAREEGSFFNIQMLYDALLVDGTKESALKKVYDSVSEIRAKHGVKLINDVFDKIKLKKFILKDENIVDFDQAIEGSKFNKVINMTYRPDTFGELFEELVDNNILQDAFGEYEYGFDPESAIERTSKIFKEYGIDGMSYNTSKVITEELQLPYKVEGDKDYVIFNYSIIKPFNEVNLSEAYHKAKADGSNPQLVQAVEKLLAPTEQIEALKDVEATAKALEGVEEKQIVKGTTYFHGTSLPKSEKDFTTFDAEKGRGVRSNAFIGTFREQKSPFFFITSEESVANDFANAKMDFFNNEAKTKEKHTPQTRWFVL